MYKNMMNTPLHAASVRPQPHIRLPTLARQLLSQGEQTFLLLVWNPKKRLSRRGAPVATPQALAQPTLLITLRAFFSKLPTAAATPSQPAQAR